MASGWDSAQGDGGAQNLPRADSSLREELPVTDDSVDSINDAKNDGNPDAAVDRKSAGAGDGDGCSAGRGPNGSRGVPLVPITLLSAALWLAVRLGRQTGNQTKGTHGGNP